ncbi:3-oxoacyl-ACP synthase III family protein [Actinomadura viridis]|uniref:3-oxoacyl-[acyl-carrier-protein] synthase-3 n=1 Tax=Actinomadura viridis TaxID=58110 RepID=A0A931DHI7_9ACTN|nr:3-oxoacyl-ACP synthase III family protein [Actinomadura viridis]MBG6086843.1 3-oxoacyl-[acyl-carrier-protein] synthase-3 [Actinomadura viridis]
MTAPVPGVLAPVPGILAAASALPGDPVDNAALAARFGLDAAWIETFVGTRTRYFAADLATGERTHTLADLCAEAARRALDGAGTGAADIDFVVLATATPDRLMPATVNIVAERLGVDRVPTYQLQSGCAGAVQAFDVARMLLKEPSHRTGLVLGGDVCVKHLPLHRDVRGLPPRELVNLMVFADGAGAAVLTSARAAGRLAVPKVLNQLTGLGRRPGQTIEWYGAADLDGADRDGPPVPASEDYKAIESEVPDLAVELMWDLLSELGWAAEDVGHLLPPQLSGRMTGAITARLRDDVKAAREISCVARTGNNGNALPFLQLERLLEEIAQGGRALCLTVESSKWIKGGLALERE